MSLWWVPVMCTLLAGFVTGWAARRGADREYIESRARYLAEQMTYPALPEPPPSAIDAEIVYAPSARLDRLEITR